MSAALALSLALLAPTIPSGATAQGSPVGPSDGRPRVAILSLSHDGSVSAELAARVSNDVRAGLLQQTRFETISGDELHTLLSAPPAVTGLACRDDACVQQVAARTGADLVVFGRVRSDGGTPVIEGYVYDAADGRVLPAGRVAGRRALDREGSRDLSDQLYKTASSVSGAGPAAWATSPWMGLGVTMTAAGVVATVAALGTAGFAYWVFLNGYLDTDVRQTGQTVTIAALVGVPVAALVAVAGVGVMAGTVLLVE